MGKTRFVALDSWRGLAALLVALFHLSVAGFFYDLPFVRHADVAVPFFFVLSGFVIAHAYGHHLNTAQDFRAFFLRRLGRLYPLHFFTLAAMVGQELVKLALVKQGAASGQLPFEGTNDLASLLANLFLLHAVIPFGDYTWNIPSWSISVEFYTYLVFALVILGARANRLYRYGAAFVVFGGALFLLDRSGSPLHLMNGGGFLLCLAGFFCGNIAYVLFRKAKEKGLAVGTKTEIAAFCLASLLFCAPSPIALVNLIGFAVVVFVFAFDSGRLAFLLRRAPFQRLGQLSYSIYLNHFVLLSGINGALRYLQSTYKWPLYGADGKLAFGPPGAMDLLALAYLMLVVLASHVTYRLIEKPGQRFFNALATPREGRKAEQDFSDQRTAPQTD